jgi:hypothetical protein
LERRGFLKLVGAVPVAPLIIEWVKPELVTETPISKPYLPGLSISELGGAPYLKINGEVLSDSLLRFELHQPSIDLDCPLGYLRLHVELDGAHRWPEHHNTIVFRHDRERMMSEINPEFVFPDARLMGCANNQDRLDATTWGDSVRQYVGGNVTCEADFMLETYKRVTRRH